MNFFNTRTLSQNQRFNRIVIIGIIVAIVLGFIYGLVSDLAGGWELHVLYLVLGYMMAYVVRVVGRGVQKRFQILGAVLTLVIILIGDVVYPFVVYQIDLPIIISFTLQNYLSGISGLLSLLFRASAIYVGYNNSI